MSLKKLSGGYFFIYILLIALFKSTMGYFILSGLEYGLIDNLLLLLSAVSSLILVWQRAKRFNEVYLYFSAYVLISLIHSVGNQFQPENLINSNFNVLIKISTIGSWIVVLLLTFNNSNKTLTP